MSVEKMKFFAEHIERHFLNQVKLQIYGTGTLNLSEARDAAEVLFALKLLIMEREALSQATPTAPEE